MSSTRILLGILGLQITVLGGVMIITVQFDPAPFYRGSDWIYVPWIGLFPTILALIFQVLFSEQ